MHGVEVKWMQKISLFVAKDSGGLLGAAYGAVVMMLDLRGHH